MRKKWNLGRRFRVFTPLASLVLVGTSCGFLENSQLPLNQASPSKSMGGPSGAVDVGKPRLGIVRSIVGSIAAAGFQYVAAQAMQQECDKGHAAACKIAYALGSAENPPPDYSDKLTEMNANLAQINTKLVYIENQLDALAARLTVAVAELKLDHASEESKKYVLNVANAYKRLSDLDYTQNQPVDTPLFIKDVLTNDEWFVPYNLDMLHGSIVDDIAGPGLLNKMNDAIKTRIDAIWATRTPSYAEAIDHYTVMETYFGYLLMQQAKGLVVVSAAYNALAKLSQLGQTNEGDLKASQAILSRIDFKTFSQFKTHYDSQIEAQIKTFLSYVEKYIADTADVDKPGSDDPTTDIKGWSSEVLKRADFMAAWARISLADQPVTPPVRLSVRVMGEPNRFTLLHQTGKIGLTGISSNLVTDQAFLKQSDPLADYRTWPTRKPYIQFPLHLDKTRGTLERDGAIKGANTLLITKYILPELKDFSVKNGDKWPVQASLGTELDGTTVNMTDTIEASLIGPDGSPPQNPGDAAIYFGHTTLVLKETAARLGIWSHGTPGVLTNETITNLTNQGQGTDSFPQSIQLYTYADPQTWGGTTCDRAYKCSNNYYAKGKGYFYERLMGQFFFEGWGDVPETQRGQVNSILSGNVTHTLDPNLQAKYGTASLELYFGLDNGAQVTSASAFTAGSIQVSVKSDIRQSLPDIPLTKPQHVRFYVEPRIKLDWDAHRDTAYHNATFKGTLKFDLSSLVLQVIPSPK